MARSDGPCPVHGGRETLSHVKIVTDITS
jgi:hypothetical protein